MQWLAEMGGGKYLRKDETISERKRGGPKNPNLAPWRFGWGHWPWAPWQVCWGHFDPGPLAGLLRPLADLLPGGGCLCLSRGVQSNRESHRGSLPSSAGFSQSLQAQVSLPGPARVSEAQGRGRKKWKRGWNPQDLPILLFLSEGHVQGEQRPLLNGTFRRFRCPMKSAAYWNFLIPGSVVACFERYKCCFRSGWFRISMASWCYLYPQHIHKTSNFSKIRIIEISPVDWFLTLDILGPVWSLLYWKWNEPHEEFLRSKYSFICIIPQNAEKNWYWWVRQWTSVMFCYFCVWQLNQ